MSDELVASLIYTSSQLATNHVKYAQKIQSEPGIRWGVDEIDRLVLPSRGGDVSLIVGRPGDGKTSLLTYIARRECKEIMRRGKQDEETVIYVTYEGTVDNIYTGIIASGEYTITDYHWGRVPIERISEAVIKRGVMPITMFGFSTFRRHDKPILMTIERIMEAVRHVETKIEKKTTLLIMDYLQLIPVPKSDNKGDQVAKAIVQAKNLGMDLDLPTFMGAQASRDVDKYEIRLAEKSDIQ
jgi:replicative DNA helicase